MYDATDLRSVFTILGLCSFAITLVAVAWAERGERRSVAIVFWAGMLLSAGSLFFFRYVELYQLQYAFVAAYFLSLWRASKQEKFSAIPLVLLLLAIGFGAAASIYLPTYLAYVLLRSSWKKSTVTRSLQLLAWGLPLIPLALLLISAAASSPILAEYIIPLTPGSAAAVETGSTGYHLFSFAHLRDVLNAVWLHAAATLAFILIATFVLRRRKEESTPRLRIAVIALSASATYLLFAHAMYGLSQDWDLAAIISPALVFFAAAAAERAERAYPKATAVAAIGYLLLQVGQLHPWVRVNAEDASADRYASLVEMNSGTVPAWNSFRSLENLRSYYGSTQQVAGEFRVLCTQMQLGLQQAEILRSMQLTFPRLPEQQRNTALDSLCAVLLRRADGAGTKAGTAETDDAGTGDGLGAQRLRELVVSSFMLARSAEEHAVVSRYMPLFGAKIQPWPEIGMYYAYANTELTAAQRREIVGMSLRSACDDPSLTFHAGWYCEDAGDAATACRYYERTIALAPGEYPTAYLRCARLLDGVDGERTRAVDLLERGIQSCAFAPERREMEQLLAAYRNK